MCQLAILKASLLKFGFDPTWVDLILQCVSQSKFAVLLLGVARGSFLSSRGLRHGDHLYPFLFVLAAEILSRGITEEFYVGKHFLLYADDTLMFLNASLQCVRGCMGFLQKYWEGSAQQIILPKIRSFWTLKAQQAKADSISAMTGFNHKK